MDQTQVVQWRVERCNELLEVIAARGRKFFNEAGNISKFEIDPRGRLVFIDSYRQARLLVRGRCNTRRWEVEFTQGGTLKAFVMRLVAFIRTGESIGDYALGPWPEWMCGGDLWGYGNESMDVIRAKARALGLLPADGSTTTPERVKHEC